MSTPSIAWLANAGEGFGIQRAVVARALEAQRRGLRVKMFSLSDGPVAAACRRAALPVEVLGVGGVPTLHGAPHQRIGQFFEMRRHSRRLAPLIARRLRDEGFNVLHWLVPNLVRLGGAAARDGLAVPVWEMPNLISDRYPLGVNRRLYQRAIRRYGITVLADSQFTARTLAGGGVEPLVNYHLTENEAFDPDREDLISRQALGIPAEAVVIGIFARLVENKGQGQLVSALGHLGERGRHVHLLLIGGPHPSPFVEGLKDLARQLGIADRVHIRPPVDDVHRYYGAIDIAANCRLEPEPYGLSVIEAMLMRKPVLVHALGGPAETVVDGETGWHYKPATIDSLAEAISRALADRERWPALGLAANRRAWECFSNAVLFDQYLRILNDRLQPVAPVG